MTLKDKLLSSRVVLLHCNTTLCNLYQHHRDRKEHFSSFTLYMHQGGLNPKGSLLYADTNRAIALAMSAVLCVGSLIQSRFQTSPLISQSINTVRDCIPGFIHFKILTALTRRQQSIANYYYYYLLQTNATRSKIAFTVISA